MKLRKKKKRKQKDVVNVFLYHLDVIYIGELVI